ncbi:molybdate ABC transporter substrate-binding protein [Lentilitoribacter sp. Alg239-R112]|uniref:molybdate ABC transporter substrate-binding protein n=1 Tax=Lentilitoribacter sp. Alg239-R112 TaxID=2305987 RepID=UPI0013A68929|nr:molybdate ABC transporter substrate-binding protein [Lentilitoribacter sp. Alg239-R112]
MAFFYHKMKLVLRVSICLFVLAFPAKSSDKIVIFAASSLTDVLRDIAHKYSATSPNVDVKISYASSGVLARQIEQGAPADIFISANQDWMTYLVDRQTIDDSNITPLLSNELVVVMHKDNAPKPWTDVIMSDRFTMGDPAHVPAGIYAKQALEHSGIWNEVRKNAVFGENVRVSLRLVSKGDVGAAIIYNSDALLEEGLVIVHRFRAMQHGEIFYPMVALRQDKAVTSFIKFLSSVEAIAIFSAAGFKPIISHVDGKTNG